jgi:sigma-B regulation protein RsbU (phosphoserine phosphatase)
METTFPQPVSNRVAPLNVQSSGAFIQALMKLQRDAQLITSTLDLDCLLDRVVNDIADSIGCVEVSVWLRDPHSDDMVLHGVRGCPLFKKGARMQIGRRGMVGHVAATGHMRYAPDVTVDPYYITCDPDIRSEVNLPLKVNEEVTGVLSIDHTQIDAFSSDQLQVFKALAGHIAVAVENARLFKHERLERERMQSEADEARAVQQSLLLKAVPLVPGFAFETAWHPAGSVAGDWFDFIDLGDEQYGIALADVSGKGMPAALLMSATRAILRSIASTASSPGQTLLRVSKILSEDFPMGKFVTMIYAILDARSREITIASAGHLRPLLINAEPSFLDVDTGLPLGLGASSYPEYQVQLQPGTKLLFYTDGITEATNHDEEEFGSTRLLEHFVQPGACVEGLIEQVQRFGQKSTRTDDATAVLIRSR